MLNYLMKNWKGTIEINGTPCNVSTVDFKTLSGPICIKLHPKKENTLQKSTDSIQRETQSKSVDTDTTKELKITVKQYMTRKATPEFDFMEKWNNDKPMPLRTMVGKVIKETRGMVYMELHGQGEPVITCMRCGKPLSNPISRHYGIGPECMSKLGIIADIEDVENIKKKLVDVTWTGWIIRSAITEMEEI